MLQCQIDNLACLRYCLHATMLDCLRLMLVVASIIALTDPSWSTAMEQRLKYLVLYHSSQHTAAFAIPA